jgi:hypothetical protein
MRHGSSFVWNPVHMFVIILVNFSFRYLQMAPFYPPLNFGTFEGDQFMISGQVILMTMTRRMLVKMHTNS